MRRSRGEKLRSAELLEFLDILRNTSLEFVDQDFVDLDVRDMDGETVLHKAVIAREIEVVKELVRLGVNLEFHGDLEYTPLHCAVTFNCLPIVKTLIEAGANINSTNDGQMTPLFIAVMRNRLEIAKYLVSQGASTTWQDHVGRKPIDFAEPNSTMEKFLSEVMAKDRG